MVYNSTKTIRIVGTYISPTTATDLLFLKCHQSIHDHTVSKLDFPNLCLPK